MKPSGISWTDYSGGNLNFVTGCTPTSAGCENCYARAIYERFGRDHSVVQTHPEKLERLWRQSFHGQTDWRSRNGGTRPMAFVCDTGDLFHEDVPTDFIVEALGIMSRRPDVIWQVLTKRPERMRAVVWEIVVVSRVIWPEHIWLGVTVENQAMADERIPLLLDTPAVVRWLSVEPMLERVDLRGIADGSWYDKEGASRYNALTGSAWWGGTGEHGLSGGPRLDWVVCGAESGPNRRPFDVAWAVDLYEQCRTAGVPFFYKQGSDLKPGQHDELPGIGEVKEWPR